MAKKPRYGERGARKNIYLDQPLLGYVEREAARKKRPFAVEVVELLEQGIIKRDGREAFDAIEKERKDDLARAQQ